MPDFAASARAVTGGTAVVRIQHNRSGIVWVVSQIAVESIPARPAANATIRRNGRYITSTATLPASAQGQPFYQLNASDLIEVSFANLGVGDNAIVSLLYTEDIWGVRQTGEVV